MFSNEFNELMGLTWSSYLGHMDKVRNLLDYLDKLDEEEKKFVELYLKLKPNEKSTVSSCIEVLLKVPHNDNLSQINPAPKLEVHHLDRPNKHPTVKSWPDGEFLADTIHSFAVYHEPPLKYEGMHTAIDVLTASRSPEGGWHDFHYEIKAYKPNDGIYIQRVAGRGHRTSAVATDEMEKGF